MQIAFKVHTENVHRVFVTVPLHGDTIGRECHVGHRLLSLEFRKQEGKFSMVSNQHASNLNYPSISVPPSWSKIKKLLKHLQTFLSRRLELPCPNISCISPAGSWSRYIEPPTHARFRVRLLDIFSLSYLHSCQSKRLPVGLLVPASVAE